MQSFVLSRVPEIVFGAGRLTDLAAKATALAGANGPVLVVADPALSALGITAKALEILAKAGHEAKVYDGLKGEPKETDIDTAANLARDMKARAIIGSFPASPYQRALVIAIGN